MRTVVSSIVIHLPDSAMKDAVASSRGADLRLGDDLLSEVRGTILR